MNERLIVGVILLASSSLEINGQEDSATCGDQLVEYRACMKAGLTSLREAQMRKEQNDSDADDDDDDGDDEKGPALFRAIKGMIKGKMMKGKGPNFLPKGRGRHGKMQLMMLVGAVYDPRVCNNTENSNASANARACLIEKSAAKCDEMTGAVDEAFEMFDSHCGIEQQCRNSFSDEDCSRKVDNEQQYLKGCLRQLMSNLEQCVSEISDSPKEQKQMLWHLAKVGGASKIKHLAKIAGKHHLLKACSNA